MAKFSFSLFIDGGNMDDEDSVDYLFEILDDAFIFERDRNIILSFEASGDDEIDAFSRAMDIIEGANSPWHVIALEQELVDVSEVAYELGRSRQNIHQHLSGQRGTGTLPKPVGWLTGGKRIWQKSQVRAWAKEKGWLVEEAEPLSESASAAINAWLKDRSGSLVSRLVDHIPWKDGNITSIPYRPQQQPAMMPQFGNKTAEKTEVQLPGQSYQIAVNQ
ncbi:MAG: hypothetical protein M1368_02235 [Thaumarchaeota archaeon]|nr:hypothetical protein [Nitrososphaerota archaeon]